MRSAFRVTLALAVLAALGLLASNQNADRVLAAGLPSVSLNAEHAAPRQLEDSTQKAVARDYAAAWQAMAEALDQNRAELLAENFVGTAAQKLKGGIAEQRKTGLHQRILDKGHSVDVVFYSPEGSAVELHDTAQVQLQVLDGSQVIHSEDKTVRYVALLTAAESSWKVRILEAVPSF